jgi:hypothetical protein
MPQESRHAHLRVRVPARKGDDHLSPQVGACIMDSWGNMPL